MGLFDRFRKRITEVADEADDDALSVAEDSQEAKELLAVQEKDASPNEAEDWDDVDEPLPEPEQPPVSTEEEDWDSWDDDEPIAPVVLSKKERKLLERQERDRKRQLDKAKKAMKKRGAVEIARPQGSRVNLSMMRKSMVSL